MKFSKHITLLAFCMAVIFTNCSKSNNEAAAADCTTTAAAIDTLTVQHQLKGWEIYSWPACNDWCYAVLAGTNSLKTYEEVTGQSTSPRFLIKVTGKEKLKAALSKFPAGETLFWASEGWLQHTWSTTCGNLQLPPVAITNEIKQYCIQAGLNFNIVY